MVMNDQLTSLSFHVSQPSHSWNKAISNFDLETSSSRSWIWSKGKTIQSAQYLIDLLLLNFTSIRSQFPRCSYFEIWKIQGQSHGWGQRSSSHIHPVSNWCTSFLFHINRTNHSWDMSYRVFDLEKSNTKFCKKIFQKSFQQNFSKIYSGDKHDLGKYSYQVLKW